MTRSEFYGLGHREFRLRKTAVVRGVCWLKSFEVLKGIAHYRATVALRLHPFLFLSEFGQPPCPFG
jgi:hypothetical protein